MNTTLRVGDVLVAVALLVLAIILAAVMHVADRRQAIASRRAGNRVGQIATEVLPSVSPDTDKE